MTAPDSAAPVPQGPLPTTPGQQGPTASPGGVPAPDPAPGARPSEPRGLPKRLLDRAARPSRSRLTGSATLLSAALLAAGSALPWVAGPDADTVRYGYHETELGDLALGSRLGTAGGDGWITLLLGLAVVVPGLLYLVGRSRSRQRAVLLGAGVLATGWAAVDLAELGTVAGADGTLPRLDPGPGLYLVAAGAVLLLLTGLTAPRSRQQDVLAESARTLALWRTGSYQDALNRQQRLVVKAADVWQGGHPQVLVEWVRLLVMYRRLGFHTNAEDALRNVVATAGVLVLASDDLRADTRPSLALASQLLRVVRTLDPQSVQEALGAVLRGLSSGTGGRQSLAQELRRVLGA
ncbi:hypothetical protein [Streptomyces sp. GQFP]|uniref:hypothetical protein n=1 Tax=Streptomyces sp. GQFP TaxID=2907545 RepID=UPI001F4307A9|nr:hypothetical protein [Streptomyces sp. GQFP]UIX33238.1 hypothetical protein LUX31_26285 [Streptomyces sp. GQFP]